QKCDQNHARNFHLCSPSFRDDAERICQVDETQVREIAPRHDQDQAPRKEALSIGSWPLLRRPGVILPTWCAMHFTMRSPMGLQRVTGRRYQWQWLRGGYERRAATT